MNLRKQVGILVTILLVALQVVAKPRAEELFTISKYIYRLTSDTTVAIYKHMNTRPTVGSNPYMDLIVPTTVVFNKKTYNITEIDEGAFRSDPSLYTLVIPKSITTIRDCFENCTFLSQIVVEEENEAYCSVDGILFNKDKTLLIRYPIWKKNNTYRIPETVTAVSKRAFEYCCFIESILMHKKLTSIGEKAFFYCTKLKFIELPNTVITLNDEVFSGCMSLQKVRIPDSVVKIGSGTFSGCSGLTEMIFPKNLQTIAQYAFANCTNLTEITFPESLKHIGNSAFYRCLKLNSINYSTQPIVLGEKAFSCSGTFRTLSLPKTLSKLPKGVFQRCTSLFELTIPSTITSISPDAFSQCIRLKKVRVEHIEPLPIDKTAFQEVPFERCILEVPAESVKKYKRARYWKKFTTIVGF